jgi:type VI secretion system protein ImpF
MASPRVTSPVQLSTLDRLLDEDPTSSREQPRSAAQSLDYLRQAVRRDLEGLLNTRLRCQSWPTHYRELERSIVGYGMPDYMSLAAGARAWREGLRAAVESIIRRFEPRLTSVSVHVMEDGSGLERVLRFRIEAMINVDPAPEAVTYDSQVDHSTRLVIVTGR